MQIDPAVPVEDITGDTKRLGVVEARVDMRSVAALYMYFFKAGVVIRTKSDLIHQVVEFLADLLEKNGKLCRPKSLHEALELLKQFGIGQGRRNIKAMEQALAQEALVVEFGKPTSDRQSELEALLESETL